ncbi:hypothetical protein PAMC26577_37720 [Caballeronia sordidicola]|uniref:Uncharacterized protein n=1 Tax=Caballeronia sordidicola TaxID=196367 RepID=A0A242M5R0_CABSO|nr:hypothetical protein PAMC26577_37720 [Caballeronia sordidicola]
MVTRSHRTLQPERTPTTQDILRVWRADRCVSASSAQHVNFRHIGAISFSA